MIVQRFLRARRAVAAVEFAMTAPMLVIFIGALADFGLALQDQIQMAGAVAQAAQYAYLNPTSLSLSSAMTTIVTAAAPFVLPQNVSAPAPQFFCINATVSPPSKTSAVATTTCSDGTNAGSYVTIMVSYTYPPLLPISAKWIIHPLSETITMRIQ